MKEYQAIVLARLEQEAKVRSMRRVYDYGVPVVEVQPRWDVLQVRRLARGLKSGLVAMASRIMTGHSPSAATSGVQTKTQEIPC
ncbi:hypothetical protein BAC2_02194 [uncultured bacterium]|nr:hypothetical protein BAC2_02194 [uncultured bacterium]